LTESLVIGARGSPLSLAQTGTVVRALTAFHPRLQVQVVTIKTRGDDLSTPFDSFGLKGLFDSIVLLEIFANCFFGNRYASIDSCEVNRGCSLSLTFRRENSNVLERRCSGCERAIGLLTE
jgi:hypothetical protein